MDSLRDLALLAGRILISGLFIYDAWLVVRFQEANAAYLAEHGVPPILLLPAGALQFFGGILIVIGLWTRPAALALAAFCIATAVIFHAASGDSGALIQVGKDAGLAGGFLFLAAAGPGHWSADAGRGRV